MFVLLQLLAYFTATCCGQVGNDLVGKVRYESLLAVASVQLTLKLLEIIY